MSDEMTKEENLKYQLETLSTFEPKDIDYSQIDVGYEHENGEEVFATVCLVELGRKSLERINELEKQLAESMPRSKIKDIIYTVENTTLGATNLAVFQAKSDVVDKFLKLLKTLLTNNKE